MVGKPLFKRYTGTYWGSWMKDPAPINGEWGNKFWFTRHFTGKMLYEYNTNDDFKQDRVGHTYELKELYFGTGHVIYQGAFYYHRAGYNEIVKYDLQKKTTVAKQQLPNAVYQGKQYVYTTEYNYFDLAVDETGLWVIYGSNQNSFSLLVTKLDPVTLTIEKTWNLTVDHENYGNGFIICGVLYLVKDVRVKATVIDYAYDLYKKEKRSVRLKFTNPFQMNNMISYNPLERQIYSWDKGNQLTYPLLV